MTFISNIAITMGLGVYSCQEVNIYISLVLFKMQTYFKAAIHAEANVHLSLKVLGSFRIIGTHYEDKQVSLGKQVVYANLL